jgi:hypothetical protein
MFRLALVLLGAILQRCHLGFRFCGNFHISELLLIPQPEYSVVLLWVLLC